MKIHPSTLVIGAFALTLGSVAVKADTLLMQRVKQERGSNLPTRGMSMAQVERQFGAPSSKLTPAGGDAPRHPEINRWVYANYTVYFEHTHVIDAVVNRVDANEIGPKGATSRQ